MRVLAGWILSAAILLTGAAAGEPDTITFQGSLIDARSEKMADTVVMLDDGAWQAVSDSQGGFILENVTLGEHVLTVKGPDGTDAVRALVLSRSGESDDYAGWTRLTTGAMSLDLPADALGVSVEAKVMGEDIAFSSSELLLPQTEESFWGSMWPIFVMVALAAAAIVWKIRKDRRVH